METTDATDTIRVTCPTCGKSHQRGYLDGISVARCLGCGTVWDTSMSPRATSDHVLSIDEQLARALGMSNSDLERLWTALVEVYAKLGPKPDRSFHPCKECAAKPGAPYLCAQRICDAVEPDLGTIPSVIDGEFVDRVVALAEALE